MTKHSGGHSGAGSVSPARLSQSSGASNAFGGYAKANLGGGNFRMVRFSK